MPSSTGSRLNPRRLYRRFPTKAALIDAVVLAEARRYFDGNAQACAHATTLEDRLVYGTVFTVTFLREHALLKKLLRTEPETILPSLTTDAGPILDFATDQSAAELRADFYGTTAITPDQERHLRTVAELHTRLTLSFIVTQHSSINFATIDDTRAFVAPIPAANGHRTSLIGNAHTGAGFPEGEAKCGGLPIRSRELVSYHDVAQPNSLATRRA